MTDEEMQAVRELAASFVLPPLADFIRRGKKDDSLIVQVLLAGYQAGKKAK